MPPPSPEVSGRGDAWESPDFGTAVNRVEIDAQGGVGAVIVRGAQG